MTAKDRLRCSEVGFDRGKRRPWAKECGQPPTPGKAGRELPLGVARLGCTPKTLWLKSAWSDPCHSLTYRIIRLITDLYSRGKARRNNNLYDLMRTFLSKLGSKDDGPQHCLVSLPWPTLRYPWFYPWFPCTTGENVSTVEKSKARLGITIKNVLTSQAESADCMLGSLVLAVQTFFKATFRFVSDSHHVRLTNYPKN